MLLRCRAALCAALRVGACTLWLVLAATFACAATQTVAHGAAVATSSPSATDISAAQRAEFARAQSAAQQILARAEFQREPPTLWDRVKEQISEAILRMFEGIDRVTSKSPWMGRALEWILFLAAATGLLVWGFRTVQRQRLRVALGGEPIQSAERVRERDDWWQLAEAEAAKGAWREAIHALYWAAIVHLENGRAWRHNPARTPREYVRLLKPGSAEQRELRGLTGALEKIWYGKREARAEEYETARESFERLAASADASGVNPGRTELAGGGA